MSLAFEDAEGTLEILGAASSLFDCEIEEISSRTQKEAPRTGSLREETCCSFMRRLLRSASPEESKLADQVRDALSGASPSPARSSSPSGAKSDILMSLAANLSARGYRVRLLSADKGPTIHGYSWTVPHQFLEVSPQQQGASSLAYVVDPIFRDQFECSHATPMFRTLLSATPEAFIGTLDRIRTLADILTKHMAESFHDQARSLPPWRSEAAMLAKWRPHSATVLFSAESAESEVRQPTIQLSSKSAPRLIGPGSAAGEALRPRSSQRGFKVQHSALSDMPMSQARPAAPVAGASGEREALSFFPKPRAPTSGLQGRVSADSLRSAMSDTQPRAPDNVRLVLDRASSLPLRARQVSGASDASGAAVSDSSDAGGARPAFKFGKEPAGTRRSAMRGIF